MTSTSVSTTVLSRSSVRHGLLVLIGLESLVPLYLIFRLNINWDEFHYLSRVYEHARGELSGLFQVGHVYLFGWLAHLGGNEVDQILVARLAFFGLLVGSAFLMFAIGRRFLSTEGSLFAVLCYFAYSNIAIHGTSFRADGLAVFLFLAALFLLLKDPSEPWHVAAAAFLCALSLFVTIKSVLYLPTLAIVAASSASTPRTPSRLRRAGALLLITSAILVVLLALHRMALGSSPPESTGTYLDRVSSKVIFSQSFFPRFEFFLHTLVYDGPIWLLLISGGLIVSFRFFREPDRRDPILLLALVLPLLSLLVYRNAFPYFYVFLMPPALLLCGVFFQRQIEKLFASTKRLHLIVLIALVLAPLWTLGQTLKRNAADELAAQRRVIEAVHQMFPRPVPYIDRNSMIASFPKVGFFMSSWGMEAYREAGIPVFGDLLRERGPVFLLANSPYLDRIWGDTDAVDTQALMAEDARVLRENYVPHWGPVYVAGKHVDLAAGEAVRVTILVPGHYTLEARAPIRIDGRTFHPGNVVYLSRGDHRLESDDGRVRLALRWGNHLFHPQGPPPRGVLYTGF